MISVIPRSWVRTSTLLKLREKYRKNEKILRMLLETIF